MLVLTRPDACHRRLIAKSAAVGCSALGHDMILDGYAVVTLASSATTPQKLVSRDKRLSPSAFGLAVPTPPAQNSGEHIANREEQDIRELDAECPTADWRGGCVRTVARHCCQWLRSFILMRLKHAGSSLFAYDNLNVSVKAVMFAPAFFG